MEKRVDANGTKMYRDYKYNMLPYELFKTYESMGMPQEEIHSKGQILEEVVSLFLKA